MKKMDMTRGECEYFHINFIKMLKSLGHHSADIIVKRKSMDEYNWQNLDLLPSRQTLINCFTKEDYIPSSTIYNDIMDFYCCNFENADSENFLKCELNFTQKMKTKVLLSRFFSGYCYCYYDFEQLDVKGRMLGGILYFDSGKGAGKSTMKVKVILGFRDDRTMKDGRLQEILKRSDAETELEVFRGQLKPHQKRFTYYEGDFCEWKDYSRIDLQNPREKKNCMICFQTVDQSTQTDFQSCIGILVRISKFTHNLTVRKICITRKFFSLEDVNVRNCMEQDVYHLKVLNQESNQLYELVIGESHE